MMSDNQIIGTKEFWEYFIKLADVLEKQTTGDDQTTWVAPNGETGKSFLGYVKELFENGGLPAERFKTFEQMQTEGVSLPDNTYALVADDTDDKNGIYIKEAGSWVKSGYDPLEAAKEYADRVPVFIRKNITKDDLNARGHIWGGVARPNSTYDYTPEYFPVYYGDTKVSLTARIDNGAGVNPLCMFYDKNKVALPYSQQQGGVIAVNGSFTRDIPIPEDAAYVRFGSMNENHANYEPHEFKAEIFSSKKVAYDKIFDIENQVDQLQALGASLYTYDDFNTDYESNGTTVKTQWIPINGYKAIALRTLLMGAGPIIELKDSEDGEPYNLLEGLSNAEVVFQSLDIPKKAKFIKVKTRTELSEKYREDFNGSFVLADSRDIALKSLYKYLTQEEPSVEFKDKAAIEFSDSENYLESARIMTLVGTVIYFKVDADTIFGYRVSSGESEKRSLITINKSDCELVSSGIYTGYWKYTATVVGYVALVTHKDSYINQSDNEHIDIELDNSATLKGLPRMVGKTNTTQIAQVSSSKFTGKYNDSPVLKSIRHQVFKDGTTKIPLQYLWYDKDYVFYMSNSKRGTRQVVFQWDTSAMHSSPPHHFSMDFDYHGNIICSYRNEHLNYNSYDDNLRRNPIILVKDEGYKPVLVNFDSKISEDPSMVRPSGWVMNCGFLATDTEVVFSEYTRPSVQTANTWRVEYPVTNPDNWHRVQQFTISTKMNPPDEMKHLHSTDLDPFTGHIYTSSGDSDVGSGIYVSTDGGRTFTTIASGVEAISRLLGFTYKKDYIWWATDSHGPKHRLYKAPRDPETGILDIDNIVEVLRFPTSSEATYATIYFENLDALLFLGRADSVKSSIPIEVWDFKTETLHTVGILESVSGGPELFGFRCECFEYTPRDNEMICGFSVKVGAYSTYLNRIKGFGNTGVEGTTVNNLTFSLHRDGDKFYLGKGTVF